MPKGLIKARKKPVEIEAMKFSDETKDQVQEFVQAKTYLDLLDGEPVLFIDTLEGTMEATPGDFVIKGVQGEFYPVKPDIFRETYDIIK